MKPKNGCLEQVHSQFHPLCRIGTTLHGTAKNGTWFRANGTNYSVVPLQFIVPVVPICCSSPCFRSNLLFHHFFGTILSWFRGSNGSEKRHWNVVPKRQNHINGTTSFTFGGSKTKCGTNRLEKMTEMGTSLGEVPPPLLEHPLGGTTLFYSTLQVVGSTFVCNVVPTTFRWNHTFDTYRPCVCYIFVRMAVPVAVWFCKSIGQVRR